MTDNDLMISVFRIARLHSRLFHTVLDRDGEGGTMQDGLILNKPTVLPAADGTLRGYGDAGPEAVVGVSSLRSMINDAVAAAGAGGNITIPVYIGQHRIETIVIDAIQRNNYRSGGR